MKSYVALVAPAERRIVVLGDGPARYLDWGGLPLADVRDWRWDWGPGNPGCLYTAYAIVSDCLGREASEVEAAWLADQVVEELPAGESWELSEGEIRRTLARPPLVLGQRTGEAPR